MTHTFEILRLIQESTQKKLDFNSIVYTLDSIKAKIKDIGLDDQEYELTIKPLYEVKGKDDYWNISHEYLVPDYEEEDLIGEEI